MWILHDLSGSCSASTVNASSLWPPKGLCWTFHLNIVQTPSRQRPKPWSWFSPDPSEVFWWSTGPEHSTKESNLFLFLWGFCGRGVLGPIKAWLLSIIEPLKLLENGAGLRLHGVHSQCHNKSPSSPITPGSIQSPTCLCSKPGCLHASELKGAAADCARRWCTKVRIWQNKKKKQLVDDEDICAKTSPRYGQAFQRMTALSVWPTLV